MSNRSLALVATLVLTAALAACGTSDTTTTPPVNPPSDPTAADFTADGWLYFGNGDLELALAAFDSATVLDPNYGPAYAGQGWARLLLADTNGEIQGAENSFDEAFDNGETGNDARAGRAAVRLAEGGSALAGAAQDAATVLDDAPVYSFSHRNSFDHRDLHLIIAFAEVKLNDFEAALEAAEAITTSGIDQAESATWQLDGTSYLSFEAAVLAFLNELAALYAG